MEKWDLLKLFREWRKGDKREWRRGWIQLWHIVRTLVNRNVSSVQQEKEQNKQKNKRVKPLLLKAYVVPLLREEEWRASWGSIQVHIWYTWDAHWGPFNSWLCVFRELEKGGGGKENNIDMEDLMFDGWIPDYCVPQDTCVNTSVVTAFCHDRRRAIFLSCFGQESQR
jgi:hypothetical protein